MKQLGRRAGRRARQIAGFCQTNRKAPPCRVARYATAIDAAAYYKDIKNFVGHDNAHASNQTAAKPPQAAGSTGDGAARCILPPDLPWGLTALMRKQGQFFAF